MDNLYGQYMAEGNAPHTCGKCGEDSSYTDWLEDRANITNDVLTDVRAIAQNAIKNKLHDDYMDYQHGRELKEALKSIYNKVSEHIKEAGDDT